MFRLLQLSNSSRFAIGVCLCAFFGVTSGLGAEAVPQVHSELLSLLRQEGYELSELESRATHPLGQSVDRGDVERIARRLGYLLPAVSKAAEAGDRVPLEKLRSLRNLADDLLRRLDRAAFDKVPPKRRRLLEAAETCAPAPVIEPGDYFLPDPVGSQADRDAWVRIEAETAAGLSLNTLGSRADTELALFAGCGEEPMAQSDDFRGLAAALHTDLEKGRVLFLRLRAAGKGFALLSLGTQSESAALGFNSSISGVVTQAETGTPIAGVFIQVFYSTGFFVGADFTDDQGRYSVGTLEAESYYVRTEMFDSIYRNQIYDGISCQGVCPLEQGTLVSLGADEDLEGIDFPLIRGQSIYGQVRLEATLETLPGLRAIVYDEQGTSIREDVTDIAGRFVLGGLLPGTFWVKISDPVYQDLLWQQVVCEGDCDVTTGTPIPVGEEDVAGIDFLIRESTGISGVVTDEDDGEPIRFASLDLLSSTGAFVTDAFADEDGRYRFNDIEPGTYYVKAERSGYVPEIWDDLACPANCNPTAGTAIIVSELESILGIDFALSRFGSISGRVTDELSGDSISGEVELYSPEGAFLTSNFTSGGTYSFSRQGGDFRLLANPIGSYFPEVWDDHPCLDSACDPTSGELVTITPGQETGGIDFALRPFPSIRGRLTAQVSGEPLFGIRVELLDELGAVISSRTSNSDGEYSFGSLQPGTYYVEAGKFSDYVKEIYDDQLCLPDCELADGTPLEVPVGGLITGIDFALSLKPFIRGTLTELGGGPLQISARVDLYDAGGTLVGSQFANFGTATYSFDDLAVGTYFLVAGGGAYIARLWQGIDCWPSVDQGGCDVTTGTPVVVDFDDGQTVDMEMDPGGQLSVSVSASADLGTSIFPRILVYDDNGDLVDESPSGPGFWSFSGLVSGTYYVIGRGGGGYRDEVWPGSPCEPDCSPTDGAPIAVVRGAETSGIDFLLEPFGRIRGAVTSSESGEPALGGQVRAFDLDGNLVRTSFPDEDGSYELTSLVPGSYYVATRSTPHFLDEIFGAGPCELICDPTEGTLVPVALAEDVPGLSFELKRSSGFFGRVTDFVGGEPLQGVAVDFWDNQGNYVTTVLTDESGRYSLDLDEGFYFVSTDNGQGFMDEVWDNVACPDGPAFEGLCDPLGGQSVHAEESELSMEVSFTLNDSSVIFADGFESGLGPWSSSTP